VPVLPAEHQLLFLAAHGAKHGWSCFGWICDLARFLQTIPIDWARVFALAKPAGNRRVLAHALTLVQDFTGIAIPPEAQAWIGAPARLAAHSRRIVSRIVRRILRGYRKASPFERLFFFLELSSGPLEQMRIVCCFFQPEQSDLLYYPFRFLRLLVKYGLLLTKRGLRQLPVRNRLMAARGDLVDLTAKFGGSVTPHY
jgi:hypothetical protein